MTYKGYQSRVELDEKTGVFHGEVINTRDVITFQGTSAEELKRAFEDSVDDYLEFCASRGEDPEKYSLGPLVSKIKPENRHDETDWGAPQGKESW
jgi:predicted HicB family RNase H-like nuclease